MPNNDPTAYRVATFLDKLAALCEDTSSLSAMIESGFLREAMAQACADNACLLRENYAAEIGDF